MTMINHTHHCMSCLLFRLGRFALGGWAEQCGLYVGPYVYQPHM